MCAGRIPPLEVVLNRTFSVFSAIAFMAAVTGCGGPDAEFAIGETGSAPQATAASQAPLFIPPEYALRPGGVTQTAPNLRPVPRDGLSTGETRLLTLAGAANADPRIRALIDQESTTLAVIDPFRIERLIFGNSPTPPPGLSIERTESRTIDDPLSLL